MALASMGMEVAVSTTEADRPQPGTSVSLSAEDFTTVLGSTSEPLTPAFRELAAWVLRQPPDVRARLTRGVSGAIGGLSETNLVAARAGILLAQGEGRFEALLTQLDSDGKSIQLKLHDTPEAVSAADQEFFSQYRVVPDHVAANESSRCSEWRIAALGPRAPPAMAATSDKAREYRRRLEERYAIPPGFMEPRPFDEALHYHNIPSSYNDEFPGATSPTPERRRQLADKARELAIHLESQASSLENLVSPSPSESAGLTHPSTTVNCRDLLRQISQPQQSLERPKGRNLPARRDFPGSLASVARASISSRVIHERAELRERAASWRRLASQLETRSVMRIKLSRNALAALLSPSLGGVVIAGESDGRPSTSLPLADAVRGFPCENGSIELRAIVSQQETRLGTFHPISLLAASDYVNDGRVAAVTMLPLDIAVPEAPTGAKSRLQILVHPALERYPVMGHHIIELDRLTDTYGRVALEGRSHKDSEFGAVDYIQVYRYFAITFLMRERAIAAGNGTVLAPMRKPVIQFLRSASFQKGARDENRSPLPVIGVCHPAILAAITGASWSDVTEDKLDETIHERVVKALQGEPRSEAQQRILATKGVELISAVHEKGRLRGIDDLIIEGDKPRHLRFVVRIPQTLADDDIRALRAIHRARDSFTDARPWDFPAHADEIHRLTLDGATMHPLHRQHVEMAEQFVVAVRLFRAAKEGRLSSEAVVGLARALEAARRSALDNRSLNPAYRLPKWSVNLQTGREGEITWLKNQLAGIRNQLSARDEARFQELEKLAAEFYQWTKSPPENPIDWMDRWAAATQKFADEVCGQSGADTLKALVTTLELWTAHEIPVDALIMHQQAEAAKLGRLPWEAFPYTVWGSR